MRTLNNIMIGALLIFLGYMLHDLQGTESDTSTKYKYPKVHPKPTINWDEENDNGITLDTTETELEIKYKGEWRNIECLSEKQLENFINKNSKPCDT